MSAKFPRGESSTFFSTKSRALCVPICKIGNGHNFCSNLGLNVCRHEPAIANRLNTNVKVRQFSTECTNTFDINMHITSLKRVFSYRIWAQPLFFFIRIGTLPTLQHRFTGVKTVLRASVSGLYFTYYYSHERTRHTLMYTEGL